jgi:14-3-3 protein epsilon
MASSAEALWVEVGWAELAERFDEMVVLVTAAVRLRPELSDIERNLMSVAFKTAIGARRASWRLLSELGRRETLPHRQELALNMRVRVEKELRDLCYEYLRLLEQHLQPIATEPARQVTYAKMIGDAYRYLAEFLTGEELERAREQSLAAYEQAREITRSSLPVCDPARLGLLLSYAVFTYEILQDAPLACTIAKQAFDEALPLLDQLPEAQYRDSTLILQLLRDNLTVWTAGAIDEEEDEEEDNNLEEKPTKELEQGTKEGRE